MCSAIQDDQNLSLFAFFLYSARCVPYEKLSNDKNRMKFKENPGSGRVNLVSFWFLKLSEKLEMFRKKEEAAKIINLNICSRNT